MRRCLSLLLLLLLDSCQNSLVFQPDPDMSAWDASPLRRHPQIEELSFAAADGTRLHGLIIRPASGESRRLILHCHGNAGNVSHRVSWAAHLAEACDAAVLLFDYRGYGHSQGSPDEEGVASDAVAAYDEVRRRGWRAEEISFHGSSLGGAVALALAERRPAARLILESTFTSIPDMAERLLPWMPRWAVAIDFDSLARLRRWHGPLLLIHGEADTLIPCDMGRALYDACPSRRKSLFLIPGGGHNGVWLADPQGYWQNLRDFLSSRGDPPGQLDAEKPDPARHPPAQRLLPAAGTPQHRQGPEGKRNLRLLRIPL